jgi:hypothetical protein
MNSCRKAVDTFTMSIPTPYQAVLQKVHAARKEAHEIREAEERKEEERTKINNPELEERNLSLLRRANETLLKILQENPDFESALSSGLSRQLYGNACISWDEFAGIFIVTPDRMSKILGPTPPPQKFYVVVASSSCDRHVGYSMSRAIQFGEKTARMLELLIADPNELMFRAAKALYL